MPTKGHRTSVATRRRVERSAGALSTAAIRRMETNHDWYRALSAEDRSWVGLVAQAGIGAFIAWYRDPVGNPHITADVFGTAPRELTRSISLRQTLDLVRSIVDVVEDEVVQLAAPGEEQAAARGGAALLARDRLRRRAGLRRGRRGARRVGRPAGGPRRRRRAAWRGRRLHAVPGAPPSAGAPSPRRGGRRLRAARAAAAGVVDALRRRRRAAAVEPLAAVQGRRLLAILGGVDGRRPAPRPGAGRALRRGADRGRADGAAPVRRRPVGAGGADRAARRAGLAGRAAPGAAPTTCCPSGCSPATSTPGALLVERIYRPLGASRGSLFADRRGAFLDGGGGAGGHRAGAVRPPQHGPLPAGPHHRP